MRTFLAILLLWSASLTAGLAQQDADNRYLAIYGQLQQADNLVNNGQLAEALAAYQTAQTQLQTFQQLYPDWDTEIVNYRLSDLANKITAIKAQLPAPTAAAATAPVATSPGPSNNAPIVLPDQNSTVNLLQQQLQSLKDDNARLQAKLREALSMQPQSADADALAKANDQIRELTKENALLSAAQHPQEPAKTETGSNQLQAQLNESEQTNAELLAKSAEQLTRLQTLSGQNLALQMALDNSTKTNADFFARLNAENQRLQARLDAMRTNAVNPAPEPTASNAEVARLNSALSVATLEKAALEDRIKSMATDLADTDTRFQATIDQLTAQRDDLAQKLKVAATAVPPAQVTNVTSTNPVDQVVQANPQPTAETQPVTEMQAAASVTPAATTPAPAVQTATPQASTPEAPIPQAQVSQVPPSQTPASEAPATDAAVAATPAPQAPPAAAQPATDQLPPNTADLVASAQRHFSNHEFDQAESDYHKILQLDPGNAMVLANLAAIELEENKLSDAQQHITAALAKSPNDAYNVAMRGKIEYARGDYTDALQDLNHAAQMEPNNPETQNYLGLTLSHLGRNDDAEAALIKAIKLDPNYAPAHNNLAVIYMAESPSLPELARWHYQKALAAGQPRNPDLEKLLAQKGVPLPGQ
jgi:Tfp pilus assembly protein PilF